MTILYILSRQVQNQAIRFLVFLALGVFMPISIWALNVAKKITSVYLTLGSKWFPATTTVCDTCTEAGRQCLVCAFCSTPATIDQLGGTA